MSGWNKIDKASEGGGGGVFIKLKDGDSVEGVFQGEPHCFYRIYGDKAMAEHENYVEGSSFRFKINMLVKEGDKFEPKILEQGTKLAKRIRKYTQEYGMDYVFKVEREGSTKDNTEYHLFPKRAISASEKEELEKIELWPLEKKTKVETKSDEPPPFEPASDLEF
jgi:hypothetical protein